SDYVAGEVGSDVFFFLKSGFFQNGRGCALVSGRGEIVEPVTPRTNLSFLLIFPEVHSSTKEAYSLVDKAHESGRSVICPDFSELKSLYYGSVKEWNFANSFTPAIVSQYPAVGEALRDIKKYGADWAEMSGSGATVFGVFESDLAAKKAFEECHKKWKCVLTH
ncbi:4-(cytidine 5'-diphospho)-2-C-methyl-D-erythritol kinase, partial [Treponema sp.]|uniref:4-(cytidine 5'-diphospho)-2-C-methyl-D-erythritol kinase n=1 Tax=Treponema sp. TaxID=166 RepID=UPI00388D5A94